MVVAEVDLFDALSQTGKEQADSLVRNTVVGEVDFHDVFE